MICPELLNPNQPVRRINFNNFDMLHNEGKRLIRSWFDRAWEEGTASNDEVFEPFIFAWFAFNGWAACVTNTDRDREMINALAADQTIRNDFEDSLSDTNSKVARSATNFLTLLPIFDVKSLKQHRIPLRYNDEDSRAQRITYYLSHNRPIKFEPQCWKRHFDSGESVPADWAHILNAIYKVRCNLFHGQKSAHSEMDKQIVSAAFFTLVHFVKQAGYLLR